MSPVPWTSRAAEITPPPRRRDVNVLDLDEEVIIAEPGDGSTYHLNLTAAAVWERCDGRTTTRQIAAGLAGAFDVTFDEALNDVEELVVWFLETGLLRP